MVHREEMGERQGYREKGGKKKKGRIDERGRERLRMSFDNQLCCG